MINTPLEAYEQLKEGELVQDVRGNLYLVKFHYRYGHDAENPAEHEVWLECFSDEYAPSITSDGRISASYGDQLSMFPVQKMIVVPAEENLITEELAAELGLDEPF
jgi:hypothetical protein